jgi:solute carrier family 12 (potassium/chloride transporters), member 9
MDPAAREPPRKTSTQRQRPIFSTRTATEDARLAPTDSVSLSPEDSNSRLRLETQPNPYEPTTSSSRPEPRQHARTQKARSVISRWWHSLRGHEIRPETAQGTLQRSPSRREHVDIKGSKNAPRPTNNEGSEKLGTVSGVFVPTTLNVLSILMFLRFGFILGQSGVLGMLGTRLYLLMVG